MLKVLMFLAMIAWGSTWVSAKILGNYINEYELIFWRFFISAIGVAVVMLFMKIPFKMSMKNSLIAISSGVLLILYNYLFFAGCNRGNAGFGGVLVTTLNPIITFILAFIIFKKKISNIEKFALILGISGTLVMLEVWRFGLDILQMSGIKWFLLAAATWPFITIISSKFSGKSALTLSFYMFLISAILDFAIFQNMHLTNITNFDFKFWINLLLLSLFGTTFGTSVYFISTTKWGSKRASSYFFLVPFSAAIFAYIFLDEKISSFTLIGGVLSLIAIYTINGYNVLNIFKRAKDE